LNNGCRIKFFAILLAINNFMKRILFFILTVAAFPSLSQTTPAISKVGYVDIEYVFAQLPEMKEMEQKVTEVRGNLEKNYTAKRQTFQQYYSSIAATFDTMSDTAKATASAKVNELQAELQQLQSDAQKTLENTRKLFMAPVYLKIGRAISEVGVENGYSVVLPVGLNNQDFVIWGDKRVNLSDLVVKKVLSINAEAEKTPADKKAPGKQ
jgi:outer membrane protein